MAFLPYHNNMQDYIGIPVEVGDYIFGGTSHRLYEVIEEDKTSDLRAIVSVLGGKLTRKVFLSEFVKIPKEYIVIYFLQKGYKNDKNDKTPTISV